MSEDTKRPAIPRVDSDVHTAPTVVDKHDPVIAAVNSAFSQLSRELSTKLDVQTKQIDDRVAQRLEYASKETNARLDNVETAQRTAATVMENFGDNFSKLTERVNAIEHVNDHPSQAPPRTRSGFTKAVGDVAMHTISEADSKLESTVALVKTTVDRLEAETKQALKAQDVILAGHSKELSSQTTTINAINTSTAIVGARTTEIATDTKKMSGWKYSPIFQIVVLSIVVSFISALFARFGVPFVVMPH